MERLREAVVRAKNIKSGIPALIRHYVTPSPQEKAELEKVTLNVALTNFKASLRGSCRRKATDEGEEHDFSHLRPHPSFA